MRPGTVNYLNDQEAVNAERTNDGVVDRELVHFQHASTRPTLSWTMLNCGGALSPDAPMVVAGT